jgi:hypothetical protein
MAPSVVHGSSLRNGIAWCNRYASELPVAAVEAATHPAHHRDDLLADGQFAAGAATTPLASMPGTRGSVTSGSA